MHDSMNIFPDEPPVRRRGFSPGSIVLLIGVLAVIMVFAVQLSNRRQIQPQPGETAPDFELVNFNGEPIRLSDMRGQIVIINFWGSWCPPCRAEAPDLEDIYRAYRDRGVEMIGVNWLDTDRSARAFMAEFDLTYLNGPDIGETVARRYNIQGAPENFVVDRDGTVVYSVPGPVTYEDLAGVLDELLAAESDT